LALNLWTIVSKPLVRLMMIVPMRVYQLRYGWNRDLYGSWSREMPWALQAAIMRMCETTIEIQAMVEKRVTAETKYLKVVSDEALTVVYPRQANARDMVVLIHGFPYRLTLAKIFGA
jgi:hypothetical protein